VSASFNSFPCGSIASCPNAEMAGAKLPRAQGWKVLPRRDSNRRAKAEGARDFSWVQGPGRRTPPSAELISIPAKVCVTRRKALTGWYVLPRVPEQAANSLKAKKAISHFADGFSLTTLDRRPASHGRPNLRRSDLLTSANVRGRARVSPKQAIFSLAPGGVGTTLPNGERAGLPSERLGFRSVKSRV